jgi:predicted lipoprotein with Yx(FWY)xxD motif
MVRKRPTHQARALALSVAAAALTLLSLVGPAVAQNAPSLGVMDTDKFGPVLVDRDGMTLYTWVLDEPGVSTCYGACVNTWPPALIDGPVVAPPGLPGRLGTTARTDGTTQLTYNDWPLYRYARDAAPGEIGGDGSLSSGGLWPVATTGAVAPSVKMAAPNGDMAVLTDASGMTLYTWAGDEPGMSACTGGCTTAWPPVVADKLVVGPGLSRVLDTILRDDGAMQVTFNGMPLYRFARDAAPGDMNGEGINGFGAVWSIAMLQVS